MLPTLGSKWIWQNKKLIMVEINIIVIIFIRYLPRAHSGPNIFFLILLKMVNRYKEQHAWCQEHISLPDRECEDVMEEAIDEADHSK